MAIIEHMTSETIILANIFKFVWMSLLFELGLLCPIIDRDCGDKDFFHTESITKNTKK